MLSKEKVINLIEPVLKANGIAKYRVNINKGKSPTLEVCIAKEDGSMDLDTCEVISNLISSVLDANDTSNDAYLLDVCSFGAERVLYDEKDLAEAVGEYVHIELKKPDAGLDLVEGTLMDFQENQLTISYLVKGIKKKAVIDYANVKFARIAVKL